ncbi:hypothetical protein ACP1Y1_004133 [Escherichia coli]
MTVPFARVPDNLRVGLFFVEFDNSMANNATAARQSKRDTLTTNIGSRL